MLKTSRNLALIGVKTFVSMKPVESGVRAMLCTGWIYVQD